MAVLGRCTSLLVTAIITMFFIPTIVALDHCSNRFTGLVAATGYSTYLTSPNYPANYSSNIKCQWTIKTALSSQVVVLELLDFNLENSVPICQYDKVTVYDGDSTDSPRLGKMCGRVSRKNITSSGQYMTVAFQSDGSNNYRGFKFEYSFQEKKATAKCTDVNLSADSSVNYLTSPNYPSPFPSGTNCQWHIASSSFSSDLVLEIKLLSLKGKQPNCTSDYVKIYDGTRTYSSLIQVLCGSLNSGKFVSTGSHMTVVFHSTGLNSDYTGFRFTYYMQVRRWTVRDSNSGSYKINYFGIRVGCSIAFVISSLLAACCGFQVRRHRQWLRELEYCDLGVRENPELVAGAEANNPGATALRVITRNSQNTSNPPAYPGLNPNVYGGLPDYTPRENPELVAGAEANNPRATAPRVITQNSQNTSNPPAYPGLNPNVYGGLPDYTPRENPELVAGAVANNSGTTAPRVITQNSQNTSNPPAYPGLNPNVYGGLPDYTPRENPELVAGAEANNPGATAPRVITQNSQNTSNPPAYPGLNPNVYGGLPDYTPR